MIREQAIQRNRELESNESSYDSTASRINFWKDINTEDKNYKNAIIVSSKKNENQGNNRLKNQRKTPTRRHPTNIINEFDDEMLDNFDNYSNYDIASRGSKSQKKSTNNKPLV